MNPFDDDASPGSPFAEDASTAGPIPVAEIVYPPQPPLGIGHMMLWMVGSGLLLAVYRTFLDADLAQRPNWLPICQMVSSVMYGIPGGAAVASLILTAQRRLRGGPAFPCQPGHWLLFATGSIITLQAAGYLVMWLVDSYATWRGTPVSMLLAICPSQVMGLIVFGVACFRLQEPFRWRILFAGLAAEHGLTALAYWTLFSNRLSVFGNFASVHFFLGPLAVMIGTVIVVILDRSRAKTRDWLHWVGVSVQLLLCAFSLLSSLAVRVLEHFFPLS